jgi:hypothetical protein
MKGLGIENILNGYSEVNQTGYINFSIGEMGSSFLIA